MRTIDPSPSEAMEPGSRRLVDLVRLLSEHERSRLMAAARIKVDSTKRLDVAGQVARGLLLQPELRGARGLTGANRELLRRLLQEGGVLRVDALPEAASLLISRGIVFVRSPRRGRFELVLPSAYALQLALWEGEDPRGLRALLCQAAPGVASSIASHYLGRPATPPLPLALEAAWEALSDPRRVEREVLALAPAEKRLLATIEEQGGEVDTSELLQLEREPMRLRGAGSSTLSRRGVGFALERRGFLIPVHPNRHVVPTEVRVVVGKEQRAEREAQRRAIRLFLLEEDHEPRRARFASDPGPLVLAMALFMREPGASLRRGVGTPRSLLGRLAVRFGQEQDTVAFLGALSRSLGLWEASSSSTSCAPGSLAVHHLGKALFDAWRKGGAWDEARPEGETLRAPAELRDVTVVGIVREMVLEALSELGDGRWVPWEAVAAYVRSDSRTPGAARLIERWAQRAGVEPLPPAEIARTVAVSSLHALGVVDLGDPDSEDQDSVAPTIRLTPRGRAYLAGDVPKALLESTRFVDHQLLRIGPDVAVGRVLALAPFVEVAAFAGQLDLLVTQRAISEAISQGVDPELIQSGLSAVAEVPDAVSRSLQQASTVLGRAEYVESAGFLWVDDGEIRELLRTRRQTSDLFVDPSPPGGLLLARGVEVERVARRCRMLGVDLMVQGQVYRARSLTPSSGVTEPAAPRDTEVPASGVREFADEVMPTRHLSVGRGV